MYTHYACLFIVSFRLRSLSHCVSTRALPAPVYCIRPNDAADDTTRGVVELDGRAERGKPTNRRSCSPPGTAVRAGAGARTYFNTSDEFSPAIDQSAARRTTRFVKVPRSPPRHPTHIPRQAVAQIFCRRRTARQVPSGLTRDY